jgi:hypothetical protein
MHISLHYCNLFLFLFSSLWFGLNGHILFLHATIFLDDIEHFLMFLLQSFVLSFEQLPLLFYLQDQIQLFLDCLPQS